MKRTISFLQYEIDRNTNFRKYMIIFIIYVLLIFNNYNVLNNYISYGVKFYFWDIVFFIFCNAKTVITIMIFSLIITNSDIIFDYNLETQIITRINSRKTWWNVKVIVLIINVTLCLISLVLVTFMLAFRFPYQNQWSDSFSKVSNVNSSLNITSPNIININAYIYKPLHAFIILIALLILGYIAIGIFIMITSIIFNKKLASILSGVFILIISLIPELQHNQTIIADIIHNNLLFNTHSFNTFNSQYHSIRYSVSIWILIILCLYYLGYRLSCKKNFYRNKS